MNPDSTTQKRQVDLARPRPLFRASECHNLIGRARRKDPDLTDAGKKYVRSVWLRENRGFDVPVFSKYLEKGLEVEADAIAFFSKQTGIGPLFRGVERRIVDHLTGEPDATFDGSVYEFKSSWSAETFINAELTRQYEYQVRAYMELYGFRTGYLVYCLMDMPEPLLADETRRFLWGAKIIDPDTQEAAEAIADFQANFVYSNNPSYTPAERIKVYRIDYDPKKAALLREGLALATEYYQGIALNMPL